MRVFCFTRCIGCQFRSYCFPHDDRPGLAQAVYHPGVFEGYTSGVDYCAQFCRHMCCVNDVLDTDGNAMQRPNGATILTYNIKLTRLFKGIVVV